MREKNHRSFARTELSPGVFRFSGQSSLEAWTLRGYLQKHGWKSYDAWLTHEPELCLQRIRELVTEFPTWQHRAKTGRPPTDEKIVLIGSLLRQFLRATWRETESQLRLLSAFFHLDHVPDHTTFSLRNRSTRFSRLLRRFHEFILSKLPHREAIVVTDATGYSNQKRSWRETPYELRATQDWLKSHCVVEVPSLLYLNTWTTPGKTHDSVAFDRVWLDIPSNVRPIRSLADGAYANRHCIKTARDYGAVPLHDVRTDARHGQTPTDDYQRLVHFAKHRPNRFRHLTRWRKLIESVFHATKQKFGHRLLCRSKVARKNEIQTKQIAHNIRTTLAREQVLSG